MTAVKKARRTCKNGHHYFKTTDCPVCPICENQNKPATGFMASLSAPALRALKSKGITTVEQLSKNTEKEILQLHGIGPASLPKLRQAISAAGLSFKK